MSDQQLSPEQQAALDYLQQATERAGQVSGLGADVPVRTVASVGVIGAGTMGGGIAMNFANAGIPVWLLEVEPAALERGLAVIRRNYENSAAKGRITSAQVEERMALIRPTLSYDDLGDVDLVVEAVFEDMAVKREIFATLDRVCKPGAILATNTSTLDIDEIAAATGRPADVVGMHFFSPANVMKLVENVRGKATSDEVKATVMAVSRQIGKVPVLVGNCHGFVGNRILHQRGHEATALVNEGTSPAAVDKVLTDFGMPMGQFAMSDLAGLDVGYRIREERRKAGDEVPASWLDTLAEQGRFGQKTQAGVYRYESGSRVPVADPAVDLLIARFREAQGVRPRVVSEQEILERCLYVMVNEAAKILEEGIASRALDVDVTWVYGYGFPRVRGGLLYWADQVGLAEILERVEFYYQSLGGEQWAPAGLLKALVAEGRCFGDLN
ncbi:MAG: 3-hydroxyacyl-CoA dehydrogenase [Marinobacter sp.]|nr:3-hydroxyacyl-CoA dehydrogenase [Marinobacter sp.]